MAQSTPALDELDQLLDEIVGSGENRNRLDDAITEAIVESELEAVRQHGTQILDAIWGDRFQTLRECL